MIALNPDPNLKLPLGPRLADGRAESPRLSPDALLAGLRWRYAVKRFDPSRTIDPETWSALEETLVLTPSSGGLQPWKFFVVDDPALRARLREASYGQAQITEADRLVVFAARTDFSGADVDRFVARVAEVRGAPLASLDGLKAMLSGIAARPAEARAEWAARQVYIALGNFLAGAAALGVDATPMEGFEPARYDDILGLAEHGYRAVVIAAAGYRSPGDRYASLPKVRFARGELIEHL